MRPPGRYGTRRKLCDCFNDPEEWTVVIWPGLAMMDILLQPDWDPGGSIPDSVGVVIPPKRCNVMNPGPVMVSPKVGMPCVRREFAGMPDQGLFSLIPADFAALPFWVLTFGSGSFSNDFGSGSVRFCTNGLLGLLHGSNEMTGVCVYIPDSSLGCVRLAGPTFGVRVSRNKQVGQGSAFDLWTMCLFGLDALRIQLSDPVAVKVVDNIGNNTLYDCWLSCWEKLAMGGRDGMQTMGQYSDTPGGYIPPGRAVLSSCSDDVKIKRYGGGGGVLLSTVSFTLYLCCVSVH